MPKQFWRESDAKHVEQQVQKIEREYLSKILSVPHFAKYAFYDKKMRYFEMHYFNKLTPDVPVEMYPFVYERVNQYLSRKSKDPFADQHIKFRNSIQTLSTLENFVANHPHLASHFYSPPSPEKV